MLIYDWAELFSAPAPDIAEPVQGIEPQERTDLLCEALNDAEPQEKGTSWGEIIQKYGPNYSSQIKNEEKIDEINKIIKRLKTGKKSRSQQEILIEQMLALTNSKPFCYLDLTSLPGAPMAVSEMCVKVEQTRKALQKGFLAHNEDDYHVFVVDFSVKIREQHLKWTLKEQQSFTYQLQAHRCFVLL